MKSIITSKFTRLRNNLLSKLHLLIFYFLLYGGLWATGQTLPNSYLKVHVSPYKGDRVAALTYSFDDGILDQYTMAVPMLKKFKLHGTFFIVPSVVANSKEEGLISGKVSWSQIKNMSKSGHEIGNHSWSHKNLNSVKDSVLSKEINDAYKVITEKVGIPPATFCFPYNSFNEHVRSVALQNHIASRDSTIGIGRTVSAQNLNAIIDRTIKKRRWEVIMIHSIAKGFDAFTNPNVLEENFNYAKQHDKEIWVGTFTDIVRYIRERDSAKLTVEYKPNHISCIMQTPLDPSIYNQPLTVVFDIRGAKKVKAIRAGKKLPVEIYPDKVCVNWIPGSEPVSLQWK